MGKVLKATAGQYDNVFSPEQELLDGVFSLSKEDFLFIWTWSDFLFTSCI